ncbi:hypothetical protein CKN73_01320 [Carnobacterium divergens]|uniref:hypothetical protein n=1 Tax=Carnobacterium divergens TaxID=2748 RepID=UPI001072C13C|nr:hypothetical protein [Carnobacterium divergens]TFJ45111.1 hypothetical protein CKN77_01315 [Carnobacterium divergens]TFJ52180.1 hypothetical protein CKN73_01320 [Carnobacterium divergens]TFJ57757.1 hypothetical protein CKN83_01315 [Carnobacterium divergens]TFJ65772.1 hypothetical protein CKN89_01320 [Carnobacterium divergens]TFJ74077.1 hypothetical protein CKN91_01315 [Carnobacterium divergens]
MVDNSLGGYKDFQISISNNIKTINSQVFKINNTDSVAAISSVRLAYADLFKEINRQNRLAIETNIKSINLVIDAVSNYQKSIYETVASYRYSLDHLNETIKNLYSTKSYNIYDGIEDTLLAPLKENRVDEKDIQSAKHSFQEILNEDSLKPIFVESGINIQKQELIFKELKNINNKLDHLERNSSKSSRENINQTKHNEIVQDETPFYLNSKWYFEQFVAGICQAVLAITVQINNPVFLIIFFVFVQNIIKRNFNRRY